MCRRSGPCVLLFPQLLGQGDRGEGGELATFSRPAARPGGRAPPWEGYLSDPSPYFARAGGPLVDMAVYPLHALTGLLDPVREVSAFSAKTRDSFEIVEGPFAGRSVPVDEPMRGTSSASRGRHARLGGGQHCASGAIAPGSELRGERGTLGISLLDVSEPVRSRWTARTGPRWSRTSAMSGRITCSASSIWRIASTKDSNQPASPTHCM